MSVAIQAAKANLDRHIREEILPWHFSDKTGCPFWLEMRKTLDFDPLKLTGLADVVKYFGPFDASVLKTRLVPDEEWIPRGFAGEPWSKFVTGGTTGDPSGRYDRIGDRSPEESDYARDYYKFSAYLGYDGFPMGGKWGYIGPDASRRLPRGVEILARLRRAGFIKCETMDVVWLKNKLHKDAVFIYRDECVQRAVSFIQHVKPVSLFCPPIMIMQIAKFIDWTTTSVKGVFAGGTEMTPEMVRHINVELFQGKIRLAPAFGNALVGLAVPRKISTPTNPIPGCLAWGLTYQAFEPHTVFRITKLDDMKTEVQPGERGRLEISTFTKGFFMPCNADRDEADCVAPTEDYPWVGAAQIAPTPGAGGVAGTAGVY